jgi:cytochrome b
MRLSMRVWDLPVRLFHALVPLLLLAGYLTWRTHHPHWHVLSGEALLVLIVWRLLWGVAGSDTARLRAFLVSPVVRRGADDSVGHGAAGGWWVLVLLALLLTLPLSGLIGAVHGLHGPIFWAVIGAIAVHLALVALAASRTGEAPLRTMISGKKRMPAAMRAPRLAGLGLAALMLFCCAGAMLLAANWLGL